MTGTAENVGSTPTNFFLENESGKAIFIEILKNMAAMIEAAGLPFFFER